MYHLCYLSLRIFRILLSVLPGLFGMSHGMINEKINKHFSNTLFVQVFFITRLLKRCDELGIFSRDGRVFSMEPTPNLPWLD